MQFFYFIAHKTQSTIEYNKTFILLQYLVYLLCIKPHIYAVPFALHCRISFLTFYHLITFIRLLASSKSGQGGASLTLSFPCPASPPLR